MSVNCTYVNGVIAIIKVDLMQYPDIYSQR